MPAGTVSNFGKQLLKLESEGGSKANVARKAKLISSIQIGDSMPMAQSVQYKLQSIIPEEEGPSEMLPKISLELRKKLSKVTPQSRQYNKVRGRAINVPQFFSPQSPFAKPFAKTLVGFQPESLNNSIERMSQKQLDL